MEPPDNDSEASDSDIDAAFESLEKTMINVASTITDDDDSEASEAPTDTPFQNPEKTTSNVDGECGGPPDQKVQMELDRIQDEQDQFISIIDDLIARLHEFLPNHVVKRREEIVDSVSEAAIGKETEVDSEVQAEVQAQESDDDLLPNTTEIEW